MKYANKIKNLKPPKNSRFHNGQFDISNSTKYYGNRVEPVWYRSKLELLFMRWCEMEESIVGWSSEPYSIPYFMTNRKGVVKQHDYFFDYRITKRFLSKNGEYIDKEYVIEVKPYNETIPKIGCPKFAKNSSKWKYTLRYCNENNMKFKIITENFFKALGWKVY